MIIPTPQPDEWLEGYRGRLSRLSDISSRVGVEPALRGFLAHRFSDTEKPLSFIALISMDLGMPSSDIVLSHSLWPAQIAIDRTSDYEVIARQAADTNGKFVFSRPMRPQTWLCPRCAKDDFHQLHFSYWRRSHQLPGQFFCREHGHELRFVPRSNHMVHLPHEHLGSSSQPSSELLERVRRSAHVARAMHISNAILEGRFNPSREHCSAVLSNRARALGMTAGAAGRFPEVKGLVDQHIPKAWLKDAMPKVTARLESMTFVDHVFDCFLVGLSGVSVAVVAALLYDDADDALKALGGDVSGKKRSPGPKLPRLPRLVLSKSSAAPPLRM